MSTPVDRNVTTADLVGQGAAVPPGSPEEVELQKALEGLLTVKGRVRGSLAKIHENILAYKSQLQDASLSASEKSKIEAEIARLQDLENTATTLDGTLDVNIAETKKALERARDPDLVKTKGGAEAAAKAGTAEGAAKFEKNLFLSGLVAVTMLEVMLELIKNESYRAKLDNEMWLEYQAVMKDLAESTAQVIREKGKKESEKLIQEGWSHIASGIGSFAGGLTSLGFNNPAWSSMGSGLGSITSGAITMTTIAPLVVAMAELDAVKVILDNSMQLARSVTDHISEDQKAALEALQKAIDLLTDFLRKIRELVKTLTAQ